MAKGGRWSPEEIALLRRYYAREDIAITAKRFDRTVNSLKLKASALGISSERRSIQTPGSCVSYTEGFYNRQSVLVEWEREADRIAKETRQQEERNAELVEVLNRRRAARQQLYADQDA